MKIYVDKINLSGTTTMGAPLIRMDFHSEPDGSVRHAAFSLPNDLELMNKEWHIDAFLDVFIRGLNSVRDEVKRQLGEENANTRLR
jgi:hypothetical protein